MKQENNKTIYSAEAERAVLGGVMMDNNAYDGISYLNSNDFYEPINSKIWMSIKAIIKNKEVADFITINNFLKTDKSIKTLGNILMQLNINAPSISNIGAYANQVRSDSIKRAIVIINTETTNMVLGNASNDDIFKQFFSMMTDLQSKTQNNKKFELNNQIEKAKEYLSNKDDGNLLNTGINRIDEILGGIDIGVLVIGATASSGKSILALNIMSNLLNMDKKCLFFSLEMPAEQQLIRLGRMHSRYDTLNINQSIDNLIEFNDRATFNDTSNTSYEQIEAFIRQQYRGGLDIVFIDFLQRISVKIERGATYTNAIADITKRISALANELRITICVLSQVNQKGLGNKKEPHNSDLRDSGTIENDANQVILIWNEKNSYDDGENPMHIKVSKNRDGRKGESVINFDTRTMTIKNTEPPKLDKFDEL